MSEIIAGIIGLLVAVFGVVIYEMITRPKLTFSDKWMRRKWVGRYGNRKKTISIPHLNYVSPSSASINSIEVETNIDESVFLGGDYFDFYGITIKNADDPNMLVHRKTAEITRTTLLLDDGQEIECRWWSRDYSEVDKLFTGEGFDIAARRKEEISAGSFEHLVIAYRNSETSNYFLFDITSDVKDNFWNNKNKISNFPRYGILKIFTKSNLKTLKLELSLRKDTNNELIIKEIKTFPNLIFIKES